MPRQKRDFPADHPQAWTARPAAYCARFGCPTRRLLARRRPSPRPRPRPRSEPRNHIRRRSPVVNIDGIARDVVEYQHRTAGVEGAFGVEHRAFERAGGDLAMTLEGGGGDIKDRPRSFWRHETNSILIYLIDHGKIIAGRALVPTLMRRAVGGREGRRGRGDRGVYVHRRMGRGTAPAASPVPRCSLGRYSWSRASRRAASAMRVGSPTRRARHSRLCGVTVAPTNSTTSV